MLTLKRLIKSGHISSAVIGLLILGLGLAQAAMRDEDSLSRHRVVIQSSSADPELQGLALVIAGNLQKHYGVDNIDIEMVAYGPGLGILTADGPNAAKVKSLVDHNIQFKACEGTLKFIQAQSGKRPELVAGVATVADGVVHLVERQEQGYSYVYPR